jgi:cytidyltransferase-like protein
MEASILWRTAAVRGVGFFHGQGNESQPLLSKIDVQTTEMNDWASYCYRWGCGAWHASGSLGNGLQEELRAFDWRQHNTDVRPNIELVPDYPAAKRWMLQWVKGVKPELQTAWVKAAMLMGYAHVAPLPQVLGEAMIREGEVVVAAPGCWDMLHRGHLSTLQWAREQGDKLIVLVNTDEGVMAQKGGGRPFVPLAGRIATLQALGCVNGIRVVGGVDDMPVLEKLKPQVLVKGSEYLGREGVIPCPKGCELRIAPESDYMLHTSDFMEVR